MSARILKCNCDHDYQDTQYGKKMRVFTEGTPNSQVKTYKCTVCDSEIRR